MSDIKLFESKKIRSQWDAEQEKWYFSITDIVAILTESIDPLAYWRKLKERLKKEGNETVTNCHALKMQTADGKMRMTDVADTEQLLRLIQSIPSPKAEPFKQWLAKVGYERIEESQDPEIPPGYQKYFSNRIERKKWINKSHTYRTQHHAI
jgi:DNA-damage-inducible protein D